MTQRIRHGSIDSGVRHAPDISTWIVGTLAADDPPISDAYVSVKWSHLSRGAKRDTIGAMSAERTLGILIYGKIRQQFPEDNLVITLEREGDYIFFEPGVPHTWEALEDYLLVTVRWRK